MKKSECIRKAVAAAMALTLIALPAGNTPLAEIGMSITAGAVDSSTQRDCLNVSELAEALGNASYNEATKTLTLTSDVSLSDNRNFTYNAALYSDAITIDLAGHTIDLPSYMNSFVFSGTNGLKSVVITDSVGTGSFTSTVDSNVRIIKQCVKHNKTRQPTLIYRRLSGFVCCENCTAYR